MPKRSDVEEKEKLTDSPAPEILSVQSDNETQPVEEAVSSKPKPTLKSRRNLYRPSHKATFIGLAVVAAVLLVNVGVIVFIMNSQNKTLADVTLGGAEISPEVLDTLGVSKTTIGSTGSELVVNPDSRFSGKLTVAGDVSIAGTLKLNSAISATGANLTNLTASNATIDSLNVNGDATASNLNLRNDLTVAGTSRLQGAVTISQLLTVNNSVNVLGNLSVGGILSIGSFQTNNMTVTGHVLTRGSAPSVTSGPAVGSNGTVSISGNDVSGTVAVNTGTGAGNGILANVTFVNQYSNIPHVVVTSVARGAGSVFVNRSASGFSIGVSNTLSPSGYAFDYIIMQ